MSDLWFPAIAVETLVDGEWKLEVVADVAHSRVGSQRSFDDLVRLKNSGAITVQQFSERARELRGLPPGASLTARHVDHHYPPGAMQCDGCDRPRPLGLPDHQV